MTHVFHCRWTRQHILKGLRTLAIICCTILCLSCTKKRIFYPGTTPADLSSYKAETIATKQKRYRQSNLSRNLTAFYSDWQGTPYSLGGMSHHGIDCSAFTYLAYRDLFTLELPRTVAEQARQGQKVSQRALQPGDLVFFKTGFFQKHVGIYLGERNFMHVSTIKGVMISSLDDTYWDDKYWRSRRLL